MVQFFDSAKVQNLSVKVCVYLNENGFYDRLLLRSGNFWKVILQNEIRVSRISTIQYFKNSDASIDRAPFFQPLWDGVRSNATSYLGTVIEIGAVVVVKWSAC